MAALCVRTSLHWLLCTGCSNMVPHSYRAGQMSYVKLLRGRREEPGNEASASSLFVFVVCFLFFGLYIKLGMHTSTSFYITIHLQKCSSVMFIPQHYLHALTVFPILVIYNIRVNITLYICSILIMHSFGGLLYNYHCSHVYIHFCIHFLHSCICYCCRLAPRKRSGDIVADNLCFCGLASMQLQSPRQSLKENNVKHITFKNDVRIIIY